MSQPKQRQYTGRFAPSPTGHLHFGSLVAALASFLQARSQGGRWLIRMDDIDPPREVPGSARSIIEDLGAFGLKPDGPVFWQHSRLKEYREVCRRLVIQGKAFRCSCSRSSLPPGPYPGTCRDGSQNSSSARCIRLKVDQYPIVFEDGIQGQQQFRLDETCGDFVIWRADDLPAYQLAAAVDDVYQQITEVVRGADLLDSTPRQMAVHASLGLDSPRYAHVPVVSSKGRKLSKRHSDDPIGSGCRSNSIYLALKFLGMSPPRLPAHEDLLAWAEANWSLKLVPRRFESELPSLSAAEAEQV